MPPACVPPSRSSTTTAYLNAGTCGPLPAAAERAALDAWRWATRDGRSGEFYGRLVPLAEELRARYATLLGAARRTTSR